VRGRRGLRAIDGGSKSARLVVSASPGRTATSSLIATALSPAVVGLSPNLSDFGTVVAVSANSTTTAMR
jgi:hypothetical protein